MSRRAGRNTRQLHMQVPCFSCRENAEFKFSEHRCFLWTVSVTAVMLRDMIKTPLLLTIFFTALFWIGSEIPLLTHIHAPPPQKKIKHPNTHTHTHTHTNVLMSSGVLLYQEASKN
jgi:hypothetical protein